MTNKPPTHIERLLLKLGMKIHADCRLAPVAERYSILSSALPEALELHLCCQVKLPDGTILNGSAQIFEIPGSNCGNSMPYIGLSMDFEQFESKPKAAELASKLRAFADDIERT